MGPASPGTREGARRAHLHHEEHVAQVVNFSQPIFCMLKKEWANPNNAKINTVAKLVVGVLKHQFNRTHCVAYRADSAKPESIG
jgi:hypothetical protein